MREVVVLRYLDTLSDYWYHKTNDIRYKRINNIINQKLNEEERNE